MSTKCRHCGSTSYGSGCLHSPTKKHEHRDDEKHCEWCGSSSCGSGCIHSPTRKQMGHSGAYISDKDETVIRNRVLEHLERFGTIKRAILTELCGISEKQATYILSKMTESGAIVKVGAGRATVYHLTNGIVPLA